MTKRALTLMILLTLAAPARAATEFVLILDNSGSMASQQPLDISWSDGRKEHYDIPAADPDRLAVIATQIFRSFMEPDDHLTILIFNDSKPGIYDVLPNTQKDVRELVFRTGTFFVGPLNAARDILQKSTLPRKVLVLETDGSPSDEDGPDGPLQPITGQDARKILGLDPGPVDFEVYSLALNPHPEIGRLQKEFLAPIGRLEQFNEARGLVDSFTRIFAESLRSRPETGRLEPGASYTFPVKRYVTEVLVALATERTTGEFTASIDAGGQPLTAVESGDAGCARPPCHAYQVFKAPHDPARADQWTLKLDRSAGAVFYGIILKYDLGGEIVSAPTAGKIGEEIDVVARMTFQGKTFNDAEFFRSDGFTATITLADKEVPLTPLGDGTFTAKLPVSAAAPGKGRLEARWVNQWITVTAWRDFTIEEWLPLTLQVKPVDFGSWTGARTASKRCVDLDLTGSVNADKVPLEAVAESLPRSLRLGVATPLPVKQGKVQLCLLAPGCCADYQSAAATMLTVRGVHQHYHPSAVKVPIHYRIAKTPFLACWWRVIAAAIAAVLLTIIVIGFVRPHDFDREEVIRLAKTEQALQRAGARRLRELPGGKRGFYRDARVAFDGAGNAVGGTSGASLVLRAQKGDPKVDARGMEEKDPRTRKFQAVDSSRGPLYLRRGVVYRIGEFFFRIG